MLEENEFCYCESFTERLWLYHELLKLGYVFYASVASDIMDNQDYIEYPSFVNDGGYNNNVFDFNSVTPFDGHGHNYVSPLDLLRRLDPNPIETSHQGSILIFNFIRKKL